MLSSLSIATSGMWAAQGGIAVTGHNVANADTLGYSRQSIIQTDTLYLNTSAGQVGYGTSITSVRQIRNSFLDTQYRNEVTQATYYSARTEAGQQIESLLGELQSEYTTQSVITDLWDSMNELVTDPSSLESRGNFVSTAITFLDKMDVVYDGLIDYQNNLNEAVKDVVDEINFYVSEIDRLSTLINSAEANGANANDYRDARNSCMDALSELCDVNYRTKIDGSIDITLGGYPLLSNGMQYEIGLRYTTADCSFVEPVFTTSDKILRYDETAVPLYDLTEETDDGGYLKGLLDARGLCPVNYTTLESLISPDDLQKLIDEGYTDPTDIDSLVEGLVDVLGLLPAAPIAPNPDDYTDGTSDVTFLNDYNQYLLEIEAFNATRTYEAPVAPNYNDLEAYPLGADDPQYIADFNQYLTDIDTYNTEMQSLTAPTLSDPPTAEEKIKLVQYQQDYNMVANYADSLASYIENDVSYTFNYDRMVYNCT